MRTWNPTYSGLKFDILKPNPNLVRIGDIAHQLALTNRFGGSTIKPISVAQHSVIVARCIVRDSGTYDEALWGLLHDAAEAYVGDMKVGMKHLFPKFEEIEDALLEVIITKYGLTWPMPEKVNKWDWIVGCNEAFKCVKKGSAKYFAVDPVPQVYISYWDYTYAEEQFLKTYENLKGA